MGINPMQLFQMSRNPLGFAQQIVNSNPKMQGIEKLMSAIECAKNNDISGLQKIANEVCDMKGTSSEMMGSYIKNQYGIK